MLFTIIPVFNDQIFAIFFGFDFEILFNTKVKFNNKTKFENTDVKSKIGQIHLYLFSIGQRKISKFTVFYWFDLPH
jgi:hypothetical protein